MLSLLMIRNGLSLKKVPRFTKITGFSKMLRGRLALHCLPNGSFLPPSPCRMPSRLPLLLSPWCLSQGRQLSPPEGRLAPLPVPRPPPALSPRSRLRPGCCWPQTPAPGGRLNLLLLMLGMQEAQPQLAFSDAREVCSRRTYNKNIWARKPNRLYLEGRSYLELASQRIVRTTK